MRTAFHLRGLESLICPRARPIVDAREPAAFLRDLGVVVGTNRM
jgi:hypothetical protein